MIDDGGVAMTEEEMEEVRSTKFFRLLARDVLHRRNDVRKRLVEAASVGGGGNLGILCAYGARTAAYEDVLRFIGVMHADGL